MVAAVTHFERPAKLFDAVMSLAAQTYPKLQIVVVDDGTRSPEARQALAGMEPLFDKLGVRLIEQENLYLGAARNRAARETRSNYLLFLDDDDIAFPTMIQSLVTAAEATGADVVNCLNLFMPESRCSEAHPFPSDFKQKISYVPLGGPLSLAPVQNTLGAGHSADPPNRVREAGRLYGTAQRRSRGSRVIRACASGGNADRDLSYSAVSVRGGPAQHGVTHITAAQCCAGCGGTGSTSGVRSLRGFDCVECRSGCAGKHDKRVCAFILRSIVPQARLLDEIARADKSGSEYPPSLVARLAGVLGLGNSRVRWKACPHLVPREAECGTVDRRLRWLSQSRSRRCPLRYPTIWRCCWLWRT